MRVLMLLRPSSGGMLRATTMLVNGLRRLGDEVEVVGPEFIRDRFGLRAELSAAARIHRIASAFDIVHAHGYRAAWCAGLAFLNRPWVWSAHNLFTLRGTKQRLFCSVVTRSSAAVAVSNAVGRQLGNAGIPRVVVIRGGIDFDEFAALPTQEEARAAIGVGRDRPIVGAVGRLSPEKGFDLLLRAAAMTGQLDYLIAGDGPERDRLMAEAPPNVKFLGFYGPLAKFYAAVDVMCVPSREEGLGLVAIEALACGKPVVASRVGGLPEITDETLVPVGDVDALAKALQRTAANLHRTAVQDLASLRAKFDINRCVRETRELYQSVLAR